MPTYGLTPFRRKKAHEGASAGGSQVLPCFTTGGRRERRKPASLGDGGTCLPRCWGCGGKRELPTHFALARTPLDSLFTVSAGHPAIQACPNARLPRVSPAQKALCLAGDSPIHWPHR